MAVSGYSGVISLDETISAIMDIGNILPRDIKCTCGDLVKQIVIIKLSLECMMNKKVYINSKIKTNNFTDTEVVQKITSAWSKVPQGEMVKYGIYHSYESNYKGDYFLSVGTEEVKTDNYIELEELKYEIFEVDTSVENSILETWKNIWEQEEKNILKRTYILDYEKYYPNGKIEIYISIE